MIPLESLPDEQFLVECAISLLLAVRLNLKVELLLKMSPELYPDHSPGGWGWELVFASPMILGSGSNVCF